MTDVENSTPHGSNQNRNFDDEIVDTPDSAHHHFTGEEGILDEECISVRHRVDLNNDGAKADGCVTASNSSLDEAKEIISWEPGDPENPYNWSKRKKIWLVVLGIITVMNSTMGSALPSDCISQITAHFNVHSETAAVLPITLCLLGYVVGPLGFGPLSETYGRRWIMISAFILFTLATMSCALAPTWSSLIFFRFLCGVGASTPIAVVGGINADIYHDPKDRGRANAYFMGATTFGPLFAPILSGFVGPTIGWRWVFWIALIIAFASLIPLLSIPETFGPVLLSRRAARLRIRTSNPRIYAPHDLGKAGFKQLATVTLTRPIRMLIFEPLVSASCAYLSTCYSIFYIFFQAYPLIFQSKDIYDLSPGVSALAFLPIGLGSTIATFVFMYYDHILARAKAAHKPWTNREEARRLPLAIIAGPAVVIALFWLGWSARKDVHPAVPAFAGTLYGFGFTLIFMSLLNYLADAYDVFSASAMAAASCCRSVCGAVLPLAAGRMYAVLGIAWASSLLAFVALGLCGIPVGFWVFGEGLRGRSRFCVELGRRRVVVEEEEEERRRVERDGCAVTKEEV